MTEIHFIFKENVRPIHEIAFEIFLLVVKIPPPSYPQPKIKGTKLNWAVSSQFINIVISFKKNKKQKKF